eukprot:TRINITY_DN6376_c0_g1_i1.p1 TRINITY_DN6376_c0_g1~~TRINITY_DN6376_c0_g1_i1.p1  ORF type:complete len:392 (+),score=111.03 TRINITY_DN6376_c0_g1_i1:158-1333(+)
MAGVQEQPATNYIIPVTLTASQTQRIASIFQNVSDQLEEPAEQIPVTMVQEIFFDHLGMKLNERQEDAIMQITQHLESLSYAQFETVVKSVLSMTTNYGKLETPLKGNVGFRTIGQQQQQKLMQRGFYFNVMVVGESGLGKSTLLDTLFNGKVSRRTAGAKGVLEPLPQTIGIESITHVLSEDGFRMKLTITDTPGFGDQVDNTACWGPIREFLEAQLSTYLDAELAVVREPSIPDSRVHACLYFIAPTGHSLTPLDAEAMKQLQEAVNIIPVIAKADTFTPEELACFKQRIRDDLDHHKIRTYPSPANGEGTNPCLPYAVVGHNYENAEDGVRHRYRKTRFGLIDVENKEHSDFVALRDMLMTTNLQDLIDTTRLQHYEHFRMNNLEHPE